MNTFEQKRVKLLAQYAHVAMADLQDISHQFTTMKTNETISK